MGSGQCEGRPQVQDAPDPTALKLDALKALHTGEGKKFMVEGESATKALYSFISASQRKDEVRDM